MPTKRLAKKPVKNSAPPRTKLVPIVNTKPALAPRAAKAAVLAAAGTPTGTIAVELGVSKGQVWRILRSADVQQVIVLSVNSYLEVLNSLIGNALEVIRDAMTADCADVHTKDGGVFPGGPDHYARLSAVARLVQLMTAGRPVATPEPERTRPGLDLERFKGRQNAAETSAQKPPVVG